MFDRRWTKGETHDGCDWTPDDNVVDACSGRAPFLAADADEGAEDVDGWRGRPPFRAADADVEALSPDFVLLLGLDVGVRLSRLSGGRSSGPPDGFTSFFTADSALSPADMINDTINYENEGVRGQRSSGEVLKNSSVVNDSPVTLKLLGYSLLHSLLWIFWSHPLEYLHTLDSFRYLMLCS